MVRLRRFCIPQRDSEILSPAGEHFPIMLIIVSHESNFNETIDGFAISYSPILLQSLALHFSKVMDSG